MAIRVEGLIKRFGDFAALDGRLAGHPRRRADRAPGTVRQRQVHAAAHHRGAGDARCRLGLAGRPGRHPRAAPEAGHRLRVPALRAVQAHDRARQRGLRPDHPQAAQGGDPSAGSPSCCTWSRSSSSPTATRPSCRVASGSAWRSPARSPSSPRCCCSTSRSAPSTRGCARSCASGCDGSTTRPT